MIVDIYEVWIWRAKSLQLKGEEDLSKYAKRGIS